VSRRRAALRAGLLLGSVALAVWLAHAGKAHTLFLDNHTLTLGGAEYRALSDVAVSVDGGPAEELERAERLMRSVSGPSHRLTIELRSGPRAGTRVVREFRVPFSWDAAVISVPAALDGAPPERLVTRYRPPPPEEAPAEKMIQQQDAEVLPLAPPAPTRP